MPLNIITFFIFYNLILFSVLGFGFIASKIFFKNRLNNNLGFVGLFGLFFLLIYSYYSHFFIPHDYIHNVIILLIGLFLIIQRESLTILRLMNNNYSIQLKTNDF